MSKRQPLPPRPATNKEPISQRPTASAIRPPTAGFGSAPDEDAAPAAPAPQDEAPRPPTASATPPPAPEFEENITAPEIFADDSAFISIHNGIATLTLARMRHDNSPEGGGRLKNVVVGRISMPALSMLSSARGIVAYMERMAGGPPASSSPAAGSSDT